MADGKIIAIIARALPALEALIRTLDDDGQSEAADVLALAQKFVPTLQQSVAEFQALKAAASDDEAWAIANTAWNDAYAKMKAQA